MQYNFKTKTYNTILNNKYIFKKQLINQLSKVHSFTFYKKDLAILFIIDETNYYLDTYKNRDLRYIDSYINDYINEKKNEIVLTNKELKELLSFSEKKRVTDDLNENIINKYIDTYNKNNDDKLDINEIKGVN